SSQRQRGSVSSSSAISAARSLLPAACSNDNCHHRQAAPAADMPSSVTAARPSQTNHVLRFRSITCPLAGGHCTSMAVRRADVIEAPRSQIYGADGGADADALAD